MSYFKAVGSSDCLSGLIFDFSEALLAERSDVQFRRFAIRFGVHREVSPVQTCPKCSSQLNPTEVSAGRCPQCGTELPAERGSITQVDTHDDSRRTLGIEVPVFTSQQTFSMLNPTPKQGTVGSEDFDLSRMSSITSEASLPESMRSFTEDSDKTFIVDVSDELTIAPNERKSVATAQSMGNSAANSKGSKTSAATTSDSQKSQSRSSESQLNIQTRALAPTGTTAVEGLSRPDYEIIQKLGQGGMGVVWLALQTSLNREVALKQIKFDPKKELSEARMQSVRHGFLSEALVTGDLNHPNIVPVYDMGTDDDGNLLYSMKVVTGKSWDQSIGTLPEAENLEILRKVADAIAFAHSRGVVHRDLKPANIMVGSYGEVLVMDWGTAFPMAHFSKSIDSGSVSIRCGTPCYMPPEQAKGDITKIGPHCDTYLLGAMLFEIVSGYPPHPTSSDTGRSLTRSELMQNVITNRIVHTSASGELVEIALKAMRTEPRDRYASVQDFIGALKDYQKHAESVLLVHQAKKDLETANKTNDHSMYARSVYGFENALQLWKLNVDADTGLRTARIDYANAALKKENFDLGLSLVKDDHPSYKPTREKLLKAQGEQRKRDARLRTARKAVQALLAVVLIGGTIAGVVINSYRIEAVELAASEKDQRQQADEQREKAVANAKEAKEQRDEAEKQRDEADKQTKLAVANEAKAKTQTELAVKNEAEANKQRAEAEAQRNEAVRQQKLAEIATENAVKSRDKEIVATKRAVREWYYSQISLADQQIAQNAFDSAREILKEIKARSGEENSSLSTEIGWELRRLEYVCGLSNDKLVQGNQDLETVQLTSIAAGKQFLATANRRGQVDLWEKNGARNYVRRIPSPKGVATALAFSSEDETLALGYSNGEIRLWDLKSEKFREDLVHRDDASNRYHTDLITHLMFLPEGHLVSTSRDHTAIVWNLADKSSVVLKGHTDAVLALARVANQKDKTIGLLTGDGNRGEVRYWESPLGKSPTSEKPLLIESTAVSALAAQTRSDDDDLILTIYVGTEDGGLKAIEHSLETARTNGEKKKAEKDKRYELIRNQSDRHKGAITSLLLDPANSNQLISSSKDNTIRTWNVARTALLDTQSTQGLLKQTLRGHGNAIVDAAVWMDAATNKSQLITASTDGTARLWRPDEFPEVVLLGGETLDRDPGAYGDVVSVSAGSNGDRIMGVSSDGVATIWDLSQHQNDPSQRRRKTMREGHRFLTQSFAFLKDILVTVSFDGTAAVWNRDNSSMKQRWQDVGVTGVLAGSPNGEWVMTGYSPTSKGKTHNVQIWSMVEGHEHASTPLTIEVGKPFVDEETNKKTADAPSAAAISPDGSFGIVGTENGYLNLIDFRNNDGVVGSDLKLGPPLVAHVGSKEADSREPDGVTGVAFLSTSDVASVGLDGRLRFWSVRDGQLIPHPKRETYLHAEGPTRHRVISMVVSADGRRIATRLRDGSPGKTKNPNFKQIWITDLEGDTVKPFAKVQARGSTEKAEIVNSISITGDGQRILAAIESSNPKTILREWKLAAADRSTDEIVLASTKGFDFQQASYLPGQSDQIAILSDTLISIRKRSARGRFGEAPNALYGPTLALQACDVSQDGTLAVTVSDTVLAATDNLEGKQPQLRGEIRIWKILETEGIRVGGLLLNGPIRTVSMSPTDSNLILVAGNLRNPNGDGNFAAELYRWNGKTLELLQTLGSHSKGIIRSRFSADGKRIATASLDGMVQVFQLTDNRFEKIASLPLGSKDQKQLALGELIAVDLNEDGTYLAAADKSNAIVIDVATGEPVIQELIQGHSNDLTDVKFAFRRKDDLTAPQRLWTTSLDGTVKFWGIGKAEGIADEKNLARLLITLRGHQRGVLSLAPLPNGGVVTAGKDGQVLLWPTQRQN